MVEVTIPCGFVLGAMLVMMMVLLLALLFVSDQEQPDQKTVQSSSFSAYDEVIAAVNQESEQFLREFVNTLIAESEKGDRPCRPDKPVS